MSDIPQVTIVVPCECFQYQTLDWRPREFLIQKTLLCWVLFWRVRRAIEAGLLPLDRLLSHVLAALYGRRER